jgi:autotransporter-associated beta strand protein
LQHIRLILVDDAQTLTLNGPVSGGTLFKSGAGTLALVGAKTYSDIVVDQGALVGDTQSLRGGINFQTTVFLPPDTARSVTFDQATTGTFAGNIGGDGAIVKTGAGELTLSGANTYTGGTTVESGLLTGTSNSIPGDIVNNGVVNFSQNFDGTYAGNLTGSGNLEKFGSGNLTVTRSIEVGGLTTMFGGALTVDGLMISPVVIVDSGTLLVNGGLTSDNISVFVSGILAVNGSLTSSLVTINPGGVLQGHGNITGFVDDKGGEIEPGNSIGTLHISGPLEMEPHSGYQVQINGASSDEIEVSGKAAIESSTFEIERYDTAASPVVPGKTYTILTTGGGLTVEDPSWDSRFPVHQLHPERGRLQRLSDDVAQRRAFCRTRFDAKRGCGRERPRHGDVQPRLATGCGRFDGRRARRLCKPQQCFDPRQRRRRALRAIALSPRRCA